MDAFACCHGRRDGRACPTDDDLTACVTLTSNAVSATAHVHVVADSSHLAPVFGGGEQKVNLVVKS